MASRAIDVAVWPVNEMKLEGQIEAKLRKR